MLLTRSPLEYPASWAFPFDLHVLSTPPAFVLSQDQTLHENLSKTHQPYSWQNFQHNLSQRDKNLTKQKLATPRPKDLSVTKINHHIIQKLGHTMPKYGIRQSCQYTIEFSKNTHLPAPPRMARRSLVSWCLELLTPSPEQLFQATRSDSRSQHRVLRAIRFWPHRCSRLSDLRHCSFPDSVSAPGSCSLRCNKKVTHTGTGRQIAWSEA